MDIPKILILCTGNSCRSHMAEGILRNAGGELIEVFSAGAKPSGYVHPKAIEVMNEIGLDISHHRSKHLEEFLDSGINVVITVCDNAAEACPVFPGNVTRHHWSFPDPADATGSDEEVLAVFREIRDRIKMVFEAYADGIRDSRSE
tara:strand:- start:230 stop:667 length:438 start_codon:yes stop_codon:yes gene_type:complete